MTLVFRGRLGQHPWGETPVDNWHLAVKDWSINPPGTLWPEDKALSVANVDFCPSLSLFASVLKDQRMAMEGDPEVNGENNCLTSIQHHLFPRSASAEGPFPRYLAGPV